MMDRPYDWLKVVIAILVTLVFWYVSTRPGLILGAPPALPIMVLLVAYLWGLSGTWLPAIIGLMIIGYLQDLMSGGPIGPWMGAGLFVYGVVSVRRAGLTVPGLVPNWARFMIALIVGVALADQLARFAADAFALPQELIVPIILTWISYLLTSHAFGLERCRSGYRG
jgi:hypothetical protein